MRMFIPSSIWDLGTQYVPLFRSHSAPYSMQTSGKDQLSFNLLSSSRLYLLRCLQMYTVCTEDEMVSQDQTKSNISTNCSGYRPALAWQRSRTERDRAVCGKIGFHSCGWVHLVRTKGQKMIHCCLLVLHVHTDQEEWLDSFGDCYPASSAHHQDPYQSKKSNSLVFLMCIFMLSGVTNSSWGGKWL